MEKTTLILLGGLQTVKKPLFRHCEEGFSPTQQSRNMSIPLFPGLLRRFTPRNDEQRVAFLTS